MSDKGFWQFGIGELLFLMVICCCIAAGIKSWMDMTPRPAVRTVK